MRFEFDEREQQIAAECRSFADEHLAPIDAEADRRAEIPLALRRELAARG